MTVTINDVAKKAKVSVATVSRVINDSILISEKTKKMSGRPSRILIISLMLGQEN